MKKTFGYLIIFLFAIGVTQFLVASQKKEARVTQVIRDVKIMASKGSSRAASVNDNVNEGTAVRTGTDSRAELTFTDQSLARLGANTVFSFSESARQFDLSSGAMLLAVPKGSGETKINTAAATAAVTGFTALYEYHPKSWSKFIVLEGRGSLHIKGLSALPCHLETGQMIIIPPHPTTCPEVHNVDIKKLMKSAKLITQFPPLPKWALDLILTAIDDQESSPPEGGYFDPTGLDDRNQAVEQPTPRERHHKPPSKRLRNNR